MRGETHEARRFGLADMMILIVATAVGLVPLRVNWTVSQGYISYGGIGWGTMASMAISLFIACVTPLIFSWAIASLVLAARRSRLPFRQLVQQPGFMLGLAAMVGAFYTAAAHLPGLLLAPHNPRVALNMILEGVRIIGMATAGAWATLLCCGLARRSFEWTDRLGRALSLGWIFLLVMTLFQPWLSYLEFLFP